MKLHYWKFPACFFLRITPVSAPFFLLFVQLVPAFCLITILLLVNRAELPVRLKEQLARVLFSTQNPGMAEIFLAGVLVSFVKLMAYGSIGVGSSFLPRCLFCVLQLRAFQCVDRRWLWDDIAPMPELRQPLKTERHGDTSGAAFVLLLYGNPSC